MSRPVGVLVGVTALALASCTVERNVEARMPGSEETPVWTMDLVQTFPGQQEEYVRSIKANWARARGLIREQGQILSYRAFVAPQDSLRGWDVMLMTEYANSTAWGNREETFQALFDSPGYVRVASSVPSAELRSFVVGGLVIDQVASELLDEESVR